MRTIYISAALAWLLLAPVWLAAQTSGVTLEMMPATLKLAPGETGEAILLVRNSTTKTLRQLQLVYVTDPGVEVSLQARALDQLTAGASTTWQVHVTKKSDGPANAGIYFQLQYSSKSKDASQPVPGAIVSKLDVQDNPLEPIDKIADAHIETSLELLEEHQPEELYLIVKNLANVAITVTYIHARGPEFVTFTLPALGTGITLEPRQTHTFPVGIKASSVVQPGKHQLLLEADLQWNRLGHRQTGSLVATHKYEVIVFGESEILKVIGVPVFILVPGFLIVTIFIGLWNRILPQWTLDLRPNTPEFWTIAITLALLVVVFYPVVTGHLGMRRDYLEGHGFRDLVYLWLGSVLFAMMALFTTVVIIGIGRLCRRIGDAVYQQYQARQTARRTPTTQDTPVSVLDKLDRNRMGFALTQVTVDLGGQAHPRALVITPQHAEQPQLWIAPFIGVHWGGTAAAQELRNEFTELLNHTQNAADLARLLHRSEKRRLCTVRWIPDDALVGPREVNSAVVQQELGRRRIVQDET